MTPVVRALPLDDEHGPPGRPHRASASRALMREFDATAVEDVFSEGLLNVMAAPEFARTEKLRRVFAVLQDRVYLGDLVHEVTDSGDVRVFIGSRERPIEMHDVSLVLAPYGRAAGRRASSASSARPAWPTRTPSRPSAT